MEWHAQLMYFNLHSPSPCMNRPRKGVRTSFYESKRLNDALQMSPDWSEYPTYCRVNVDLRCASSAGGNGKR